MVILICPAIIQAQKNGFLTENQTDGHTVWVYVSDCVHFV